MWFGEPPRGVAAHLLPCPFHHRLEMAVDGDGAEVAAPVTGPSSFEALREPVTAVVRECLDARLKESDDYSGKRVSKG